MPEKKNYNSFAEVERIAIKLDQGGELLILLKMNEIRIFKLEYYLNGQLLKPENLKGKNLAYKRWSELMTNLIENRDGYQPLTPEDS